MRTYHSALFLDYDNVRTELERYDPTVAARFSNKPLTWLKALETELADVEGALGPRRIVSRRCFASPHLINPYRRNFTQTGFEVVDCPPLTSHQKNSGDIYIVMDVMDYLGRYPHIDEYIILSGDADFVPVLNRLRRELKRSVIFASYNTTAAYKNCSDERIEAEFFAEHLASAVAARPTQIASADSAVVTGPELRTAIEESLTRAAARRAGHAPFAAAAQALLNDLGAELGGNWAGYGTFTALLERMKPTGIAVDWQAQQLMIPDFVLDLPRWDEDEREHLSDFLTDVAASTAKTIPLLRPGEYRLIFDELAAYFRTDEPGTFTQAINTVSDTCREKGADVTPQEVRFVATGISMQQYRFAEGADARHLAALWRTQIFDLCGEPDWMREPEDAERLAFWIRASDETVEDARDDFLARTGEALDDSPDESDPLAAE